MKALTTIENHGVAVNSVPEPKPGPGEIFIKIAYVAQNPADWKDVATAPPGRIGGCDFAGTIQDANESMWKQGQRVAGWVHGQSTNPDRGAFAELAVTEASLVFAVPDSLSFQEAAVVPFALLKPSLQMLRVR
jgi:NADPH:quinone reductase-like Zn-dependent oxidoreductase